MEIYFAILSDRLLTVLRAACNGGYWSVKMGSGSVVLKITPIMKNGGKFIIEFTDYIKY